MCCPHTSPQLSKELGNLPPTYLLPTHTLCPHTSVYKLTCLPSKSSSSVSSSLCLSLTLSPLLFLLSLPPPVASLLSSPTTPASVHTYTSYVIPQLYYLFSALDYRDICLCITITTSTTKLPSDTFLSHISVVKQCVTVSDKGFVSRIYKDL